MIDIRDNSGKVLFSGDIEKAEEFLRMKKRIDKEFRDNEIRDWGCGLMIALLFIGAIIFFVALIS